MNINKLSKLNLYVNKARSFLEGKEIRKLLSAALLFFSCANVYRKLCRRTFFSLKALPTETNKCRWSMLPYIHIVSVVCLIKKEFVALEDKIEYISYSYGLTTVIKRNIHQDTKGWESKCSKRLLLKKAAFLMTKSNPKGLRRIFHLKWDSWMQIDLKD